MKERGKYCCTRTTGILALLLVPVLAACNRDASANGPGVGDPMPSECVGSRVPEVLKMGVGGYWGGNSSDEAFRPVADFIEARLGIATELVTSPDYDTLVDKMAAYQVDVALLPPLAYVKAREAMPCLRLLRTMVSDGAVYYSGYIIVNRDSPLVSLAQLKGRKMGLVERSSASGYLFPLARLMDAGIDPARDLELIFLGSHEAVINAVLHGEVDAGATFQGALVRARGAGIQTGALRILAVSGRIPLDAFVAKGDLSPRLVEALSSVLDGLNSSTASGRKALSRLPGINGWVPTRDHFYDRLRDTLARIRSMGEGAP